jgi:ABC-type uncharacterized transport system substrate-binding protein
VEGKNIVIEYRYAEEKLDRLPVLAAELVRLKVDVIVTAGPAATRPAKEATATIPIVMTQDPDPVGSGFVASLARPGGNITGLSTLSPEISGKRLELLKEIVPKLSRVAVLGTSTRPGTAQELKEVELAAGAFGVELQYLDVLDPKDIETAFRAASKSRADAVLMLVSGGVVDAYQTTIIELAVKTRLPVIYGTGGRAFVEAGGLMFYGVNINDLDRRAATFVDKILKGAGNQWRAIQAAARDLHLALHSMEIRSDNDFEGAFKNAVKARSDALTVTATTPFSAHRKRIIDLAAKNRLPAMYASQRYVETGGLMYYGPSDSELYRRAAVYVDKILKGTKPADLPVEQPKKFEFIINLKTAKQIGLTIPPNVLARADKVIR